MAYEARQIFGFGGLLRSLICLVGLAAAFSAHAETSSSTLRALFGQPTKTTTAPPTEVFAVQPGLEMTATYANADGPVCKLKIPSHVASRQQVLQILEQVVPVATRGKEWNSVYEMSGNSGFESTYYERLIISVDEYTSRVIDKNPGATVIFKNQLCGWKPGSDVFDTPSRPKENSGRK
jgi:hypothetical protein